MYRKIIIVLITLIFILACKSNTNQIVNHKREGKWITYDTLDFIYTTIGKYKNGNEIGVWKQYYNKQLVKKERYHKKFSKIIYYHPNGKVMKKGYAKTDNNDLELHWYYFGKWYFYNISGKLDSIKTYQKENISTSL